jgi:hypothetical protein
MKKNRTPMRDNKRDGNGNGNGHGQPPKFHFAAVEQFDVPHGRKGKHRTMVSRILEDLGNRTDGQAVRIPLSSLQGEKVQNLRSALNRVTRLKKTPVATASDDKYLYVWNAAAANSRGPASNVHES